GVARRSPQATAAWHARPILRGHHGYARVRLAAGLSRARDALGGDARAAGYRAVAPARRRAEGPRGTRGAMRDARRSVVRAVRRCVVVGGGCGGGDLGGPGARAPPQTGARARSGGGDD